MVSIFQTNNACDHITYLHLACAACCLKELGVEATRVHFPNSARIDIAVLNANNVLYFSLLQTPQNMIKTISGALVERSTEFTYKIFVYKIHRRVYANSCKGG